MYQKVRSGKVGDPERTDMQSRILLCWMIRSERYLELEGEEGRLPPESPVDSQKG